MVSRKFRNMSLDNVEPPINPGNPEENTAGI